MKHEHCRNYPLSREHAENTSCPGFDGTIKKNNEKEDPLEKQLWKAADKLMIIL